MDSKERHERDENAVNADMIAQSMKAEEKKQASRKHPQNQQTVVMVRSPRIGCNTSLLDL